VVIPPIHRTSGSATQARAPRNRGKYAGAQERVREAPWTSLKDVDDLAGRVIAEGKGESSGRVRRLPIAGPSRAYGVRTVRVIVRMFLEPKRQLPVTGGFAAIHSDRGCKPRLRRRHRYPSASGLKELAEGYFCPRTVDRQPW